ncbi:hypothetical protein Bca52824_010944 [Brassica carinata]|uniref:Acyl-ACP thioesterase-like C-terminal domain-containing protein n=1 Tax=Brassica carinata TaxID=52824 RepID=A0A8X7WDP7_BRACI|nr:hypothetical protein Bca52824_010944 [Brassica carinata]
MPLHLHYWRCQWLKNRRVKTTQWSDAMMAEGIRFLMVDAHHRCLLDGGNRFMFGSLMEDGLSYKEKFIVRSHEVQCSKTAMVQTNANLLQVRRWYVISFRALDFRWMATRHDWVIKDTANGVPMCYRFTKWVMMNQDTRRYRQSLMMFEHKELRLAFSGEENNRSLKKIPKLEDLPSTQSLDLRRADLDMNHHVNNVTYIGWLLESIPQDIVDTHTLQIITLDYRRECGGFTQHLKEWLCNIRHKATTIASSYMAMNLDGGKFQEMIKKCNTLLDHARQSHKRIGVIRIETTTDNQKIAGLSIPNEAVETVLQDLAWVQEIDD